MAKIIRKFKFENNITIAITGNTRHKRRRAKADAGATGRDEMVKINMTRLRAFREQNKAERAKGFVAPISLQLTFSQIIWLDRFVKQVASDPTVADVSESQLVEEAINFLQTVHELPL